MLVPPVLVGGDHDKLMQSLKALTIFGVEGGPGNAVTRNLKCINVSLNAYISNIIRTVAYTVESCSKVIGQILVRFRSLT